jgi:2-haloacid dehalogenase
MARILVFDAYGTLFDVHSPVAQLRAEVGPEADRLSELWRLKQLEYTWIAALTGRHQSFRAATEAGLDYAIAKVGGLGEGLKERLLEAYATLAAYPEVTDVLKSLRARGHRLAILSNGDPDMLQAAVQSAGLSGVFEAIMSSSEVGIFKPSGRVYRLATTRLKAPREHITFVSSNRWDVAGAVAFGLPGIWVNRSGLPDEYPTLPPEHVLPDLTGLMALA